MSDEMYGAAIKDLAAREPVSLAHPDKSVTLDNPLCGDRVSLGLRLEGGRVAALGHGVKGCLLCKAASSVAAEQALGLDAAGAAQLLDQVRGMLKTGGEPAFPALAAFLPVRPHKSRHDCVLLPFKALSKALRP
ncbi:Iron-sulfur cluster assembly scaffold protein IscU [Paramagnetospirillum magnetotacticum MS-1]|uniref:Iron-sulfur cluster assembly scaffold protein IscU n=1 Tax=Paramagnetospirillum magnetotacticum MS-1 TaxID=272627 RepID=A0A0C2YXG9_PARME|nr:iron-sulfur cluster assembly scaffold protein [Paramagnetospirillum magnetotacticum]KIL99395.1 Iron-sulfur cluster assembly scaffold protein IscU [Paramagnetospirillum magnetotacticum MS-1]